ncbi:MAG: lipoate--protein ligase family protein [Leptolyngbya sp. LCM1.Bin17]|nr:MAG: lipoate--protein ligase family protein [Leptolyngbya sp. LCM1.Bin17]
MAAPGAVHMAIDQWLLNQHQHHGHPPCLRFYTWQPAAISLGFSQRRRFPEAWSNLTWNGQPIPLVQRPTGGRGVLHQGDLTYALITSPATGRRQQVYRDFCQFLIQGWRALGVSLQFGQPQRQYGRSHHCFSLATQADLVDTQGHKRIGSAQLWRDGCVLQHGSMVLTPDPILYQQVFQTPPPPPGPMGEVDQAAIARALCQAAAQCFDCELQLQPLSDAEWQQMHRLQNPAIGLDCRADCFG